MKIRILIQGSHKNSLHFRIVGAARLKYLQKMKSPTSLRAASSALTSLRASTSAKSPSKRDTEKAHTCECKNTFTNNNN